MANLFESKKKGGPSVNLQASKTVTAGTSQITVDPDTGYDAMEEVVVNPTPSTDITPSNSSPVSLTSGNLYKPSAAGKAVASVTDITPSNSSPASMSTGNIYKPSTGGYAITSYPSKTPASSGTQFDAGMVKMSSGGYAYNSQPATPPNSITLGLESTSQSTAQVRYTRSDFSIPRQLCALYSKFKIIQAVTAVLGNNGSSQSKNYLSVNTEYTLGSTYDLGFTVENDSDLARLTVQLYN